MVCYSVQILCDTQYHSLTSLLNAWISLDYLRSQHFLEIELFIFSTNVHSSHTPLDLITISWHIYSLIFQHNSDLRSREYTALKYSTLLSYALKYSTLLSYALQYSTLLSYALKYSIVYYSMHLNTVYSIILCA